MINQSYFRRTMQMIRPSKDAILRQFFTYAVVGGVAFLVDYGTLLFCTEYCGLHYLSSATMGFMVGLLTNYVLSIHWVFDIRRVRDARAEFVIFGLVGLAGLAISISMLYLLTDGAGIDYKISKPLTAGVVLIFNFVFRRWFLFSNR